MQAAHFLRDTDFCCRKERTPEAPGNSTLDAAPGQVEQSLHLPQHNCPLCAPGTPTIGSWHQDTAAIPLTILAQPTAGALRFPPSSGRVTALQPAGVGLQAPRAGPTTRGQHAAQRTHQHLSYTVLLANIAEVPRHVGLEPDVLPICRGLLDSVMNMLSAHLPPTSPVRPHPDLPTLSPPR